MSAERDGLAEVIAWVAIKAYKSGTSDHCGEMADAILAAGWRKHRTITTLEELDTLPGESVVRDAHGIVYELDYTVNNPGRKWWIKTGETMHYSNQSVRLPATVLYEPRP